MKTFKEYCETRLKEDASVGMDFTKMSPSADPDLANLNLAKQNALNSMQGQFDPTQDLGKQAKKNPKFGSDLINAVMKDKNFSKITKPEYRNIEAVRKAVFGDENQNVHPV